MFKIAMRVSDHIRESTAILQDVDVPMSKPSIDTFLQFVDSKLVLYPQWLCPVRKKAEERTSKNVIFPVQNPQYDYVLNFGLYGVPKTDLANYEAVNKEIEKVVANVGGKKALYSHCYYTPEEFWKSKNSKNSIRLGIYFFVKKKKFMTRKTMTK